MDKTANKDKYLLKFTYHFFTGQPIDRQAHSRYFPF